MKIKITISIITFLAIVGLNKTANAQWWKYAYSDSAETFRNAGVVIHVLANDSLVYRGNVNNPVNNPTACDYDYVFGALQSENGGTLVYLNGDSVRYTPPLNYVGWDRFYYGICSGSGTYQYDTAVVFVNVKAVGFFMSPIRYPQLGVVEVPVKVSAFDSIMSFQGTIAFDTAALKFDGVEQYGALGAELVYFGTIPNLVNNGKVTYIWTDAVNPHTVADSTTIFTLRFKIKAQWGLQTTVHFTGIPTQQEVVDGHLTVTTALYADGQIMVPYCSAAFSVAADPNQLHHYLVTNYAYGILPLKYDWNWGDGSDHDTIAYPTHTYSDTGFYDICLSILDSTLCPSTYCDNGFHALRTNNTMVGVTVVAPVITGTVTIPWVQEPGIYPNPVKDRLFITNNGTSKGIVTVYNLLGEAVYVREMNHQQEIIDCASFRAGVYFLEVKSENGKALKKFVKE